MRGLVVRLSITAAVLGALPLPRAEAHGMAGAPGGARGAAVSIHAGPTVERFHGSFVGRPRFVSNRFVHPRLHQRQLVLPFLVTVPWSSGIWPGNWSPGSGYGYQPAPQTKTTPETPQVIVIHADGEGRTTTLPEPTPDYSYVKGCRAIANGYHCDVVREAR
jgi:hypothetical protein